MNKYNKFIALFTFSIIILSSVASVNAISSDQQAYEGDSLSLANNFLQLYSKSFKSPDNNPIVAYAKYDGSSKYLAEDQAQIALDYLELAQEAQNSQMMQLRDTYISQSLSTLKFMTSYLVNSLTRDKNGIIEFWDTSLQDLGLTRVSKIARDQALTLLVIDKLLTFIDNGYSVTEAMTTFYKESFTNLWQYLQGLYDTTNGGWFAKTTALNQTAYTIDTTKSTADNMIIISALSQIKHISFLETGFTKQKLETMLSKSMNLFLTKFLVANKGIVSFGSADGSSIATGSFFAKDNSLFGLACLDMYTFSGNTTYLSEAQNIWSFLKNDFWEIGFGGVFIGINDNGDPTIAGKSIDDQIYFALLSLRLSSLVSSNTNYMAYYLTMSTLIKKNFVNSNRVASSTDLRFNPSSEYYVQSAADYINFLVQIPHVSVLITPKSVIIGSEVPVTIFISNINNIPLNISITSDNYLNPASSITNASSFETSLKFNNDVTTGSQNIYFVVSILKTNIQSITAYVTFSPNVRIPNGLIYLLGAGILAGLVVLVRRPPAFLKKYIDELREERTEVSTVEVNTTENMTNE